MAEMLGRKASISVGGTVIATARTKSLTINNSTINVTSDGDDGIQRLLAEPGEKSIEMTLDGLWDNSDTAILDAALSSNLLVEIILDMVDYTLTGDFIQSSFAPSFPYNEAITFSASYSSTGAFTKAATP